MVTKCCAIVLLKENIELFLDIPIFPSVQKCIKKGD